jgi:4-amino-4-deoxy-L-arabinose transferase-like glycosyltransferase
MMSQMPAVRSLLERRFRTCAAALLLLMGTAQLVAVLGDSQTGDESYHLVNGYAFLKTRALLPISEHPPISQVISALPLLALNLWLPRMPGPNYGEFQRASDFLYQNRYPADTILLLGRMPKILVTLLTGLMVAWWTRRRFGELAALAALTLFCFDPNFLAHGHYATTDVPATLFFVAACLAWSRFLTDGTMRSAAVSGLAVGAAMATKYSAILLFFIFVGLYLIRLWQQMGARRGPVRWSPFHLAKGLTVVVLVMLAVVFAAFGFETGKLMPPESIAVLQAAGFQRVGGDTSFDRAAADLTIPAPSFFRGLTVLTLHNFRGHPSYLLGQRSQTGWWYYFPVVVAVKTPTGTLLLLLLALTAAATVLFRGGPRETFVRLKRLSPHWYILLFPPVLYLAVCMQTRINLGIRHILPIYPLMFMWIAAVLFSRQVVIPAFLRKAAVVCLALVVLESASVFPRHLGFFNLPSGGPRQGWKYLVDSNLDWGQDLKRLKSYLVSRGISNVCLDYFGTALPSYYGIESKPAPASLDEARSSGCVVVMSITAFYEFQPFDGRYDWMLRTAPTDTVGDSFRVYDLKRIAVR